MEQSKIISFIQTLITKTKSKEQRWYFVSDTSTLGDQPGMEINYIYGTSTAKGTIYLGSGGYRSSSYTLLMQPNDAPLYDSAEMISWNSKERKDYSAALKELYQIVYNSLPNPDSFIDDFLGE